MSQPEVYQPLYLVDGFAIAADDVARMKAATDKLLCAGQQSPADGNYSIRPVAHLLLLCLGRQDEDLGSGVLYLQLLRVQRQEMRWKWDDGMGGIACRAIAAMAHAQSRLSAGGQLSETSDCQLSHSLVPRWQV